MPKKNESGKRVGKPTLYKNAMKRHNVHLSDEHVKTAIALSGEISAGIRLALESASKERDLIQIRCHFCNGAGVLMTAIGSKLCPRCDGSGNCKQHKPEVPSE